VIEPGICSHALSLISTVTSLRLQTEYNDVLNSLKNTTEGGKLDNLCSFVCWLILLYPNLLVPLCCYINEIQNKGNIEVAKLPEKISRFPVNIVSEVKFFEHLDVAMFTMHSTQDLFIPSIVSFTI
jgi:hypothetical protein